jgi:hypothetical protein
MQGILVRVLAAALCLAVTARVFADDPTTQPDPDAVRLTFLGDRLSSVEASIGAINHALVVAGYQQSLVAGQAENYQKGNEIMNRNGGGPVAWQDFYGRTARSFIVRDTVTGAAISAGPNGVAAATVTAEGGVRPVPRPPEFNYIYKANNDEIVRAKSEVAALGNQIDALLARRRELESEQSMLWATMSFESIQNRDIPLRPLYHYQLTTTPSANDDNRPDGPRLDIERALVLYLRTADHAASELEDRLTGDQPSAYRGLRDMLRPAQETALEAAVTFTDTPGVGAADAKAIGDAAARVRRIQSLCKNICDAYDLAIDGDRQADEPRKQTFRGQLQESLLAFAETAGELDDSLVTLAARWDIRPQVGKPSADTVPEPIVTNTAPPPDAPAPIAAPVAAPADTGGAVETASPPTPGVQAGTGSASFSDLTDKLNRLENWKISNGSWTQTPGGPIRGQGNSMIEFTPDLPTDCTISFHMNVVDGMRPRVHFDGPNIYVGNEGFTKNIAVRNNSKKLLGSAFVYKNGDDIAVTVSFHGQSFSAQVGDQITEGPCQTGSPIRLRLQGGDGWSKGTTEYSEFVVGPPTAGKDDTATSAAPPPNPADSTQTDAGMADGVDLLKMVDLTQDIVRDNWRFVGSNLLCPLGAGDEIVEFPYVPPMEYDFRVSFTRTQGDGAITFVCLAGGRQIAWTLGAASGTTSGFWNVNGNHYDHNRTTRHTDNLIANGRPHVSVVKVRQDRLDAFLDDVEISSLQTNAVNFSLPKEFDLHQNKTLGVVAFKDAINIDSAQIIEISGHGHPSR